MASFQGIRARDEGTDATIGIYEKVARNPPVIQPHITSYHRDRTGWTSDRYAAVMGQQSKGVSGQKREYRVERYLLYGPGMKGLRSRSATQAAKEKVRNESAYGRYQKDGALQTVLGSAENLKGGHDEGVRERGIRRSRPKSACTKDTTKSASANMGEKTKRCLPYVRYTNEAGEQHSTRREHERTEFKGETMRPKEEKEEENMNVKKKSLCLRREPCTK
ncbi:hypothetical protein BDW22DRAFT_1345243 [Trametopsis cervina]|nr:hypothetical protein BDW22DRAFT_1345243 [Trametopsis cervina]